MQSSMMFRNASDRSVLNLRAGELVEVRSKEEILAALDVHGRMEALPFMPEMLQYCGKRFRVFKRADKTCDTVGKTGSRRMEHAVHLANVRCDGAVHGGCQAGCLIFWKEGWLTRVGEPAAPSVAHTSEPNPIAYPHVSGCSVCTEDTIVRESRRQTDGTGAGEVLYSCQATELPKATADLAWWDIRQYVRDISSGNVGLAEFAWGLSAAIYGIAVRFVRQCLVAVAHRLGGRSVANAEPAPTGSTPAGGASADMPPTDGIVRRIKSGLDALLVEYPHVRGRLRVTPSAVLNLQPGEFVRVKTNGEILETLDVNNRNRGLLFDVEMLPYCGGTYRVLRRVERILDEKTGRMRTLPNNCIILDGVVCKGCFSRNRRFCPRSIYPYWHEIWLRRAE